jgi:AAA domain
MSLEFWSAEEFRTARLPAATFLVKPYLARGSIVLLHGPAGASKSQLVWHLLEAVQHEKHFFGFPTKHGEALLLSVDQAPQLVRQRWQEQQADYHFDVCGGFPFDLARPDIGERPEYQLLKAVSQRKRYDVVAIETTAHVYAGSVADDQAPALVYGFFRHLFPEAALIFTHYNSIPRHYWERRRDEEKLPSRTGADVLGSVNWFNFATTVLLLAPATESVLKLTLTKSQIARDVNPLLLYRMPDIGTLEAWDDRTQAELGRLFDGMLLLTGHNRMVSKAGLPGLFAKLQKIPEYQCFTLLQLQDVFRAWCMTRLYDVPEPEPYPQDVRPTNGGNYPQDVRSTTEVTKTTGRNEEDAYNKQAVRSQTERNRHRVRSQTERNVKEPCDSKSERNIEEGQAERNENNGQTHTVRSQTERNVQE